MTSTTPTMLSVLTVAKWKDELITEALDLHAYGILNGTEEAPSSGSDAKLIHSFNQRQSRLASYIRKTLDEVQRQTILAGIDVLDVCTTYKTLLEQYEPKTSASRVSVIQELVSFHKKDDETYSEYGSRSIAIANRLLSLLPSGPVYSKEVTQLYETTKGTGEAAQKFTYTGVKTPSKYTEGYGARDLCLQLALSMIPIGLGNAEEDKLLRHTLNHLDETQSDSKATLEHLQRADTMTRNLAVQEDASAAALAASTKMLKFKCTKHGPNPTHDTKDCKVLAYNRALKEKAAAKDSAKSADSSSPDNLSSTQQAMMASVSHIRSPAVRHSHRTHHPKPTADDPWNPDSGATKHMTGNAKWLRHAVNVRVAVELANKEVVWATKMGQV